MTEYEKGLKLICEIPLVVVNQRYSNSKKGETYRLTVTKKGGRTIRILFDLSHAYTLILCWELWDGGETYSFLPNDIEPMLAKLKDLLEKEYD